MNVPGVVGYGDTILPDGRKAILVMLESMTPEAAAIPATIEGKPVKIEVTGAIVPQ